MRGYIIIDDGMPEHPKIVGLDGRSAWTFVCSIAYANRNLTDGFVPEQIAFHMADASHGEPGEVAEELVEAGLWEVVEGGYQIHDYLAKQRSKKAVLLRKQTLSKLRSEAGRKGGKASGRARSSVEANAKQTGSKTKQELELKKRTARTREGRRRTTPETRPAAAAYQPFQNSHPDRDTNAGLDAIREILGDDRPPS